MPTPRRLGVHLAVMASYLAMALVALRPLGSSLARTLPRAEQHDVLLHGWILVWTARQLLRAPWDLFDANVFFPYPGSLAYTEHLLPEALPVAPLYSLTGDPVTTYNVAYLLVFVLGGWGTFLLLRRLTGDPWAAWVGGAFACWFPARRWNLAHINTLAVHGVPFALLALHRLLQRPGVGAALLAGVAVALASLTSAYYTVYLPLILLVVVPLMARADGRPRDRQRLVAVGIAAATAMALAASILWPYLRTWGGDPQPWNLQVAGAVDVGEFLILDSLLWREWLVPADLGPLTTPFFPGLLATGLALLAVFGRAPAGDPGGPGLSGLRRRTATAGYGLAVVTALGATWYLVAHHRAILGDRIAPSAPRGVLLLGGAVALALVAAGEGRRFPRLPRLVVRRWGASPPLARVWAAAFGLAVLLALGPRLKFFGYAGPPLPYELVWRFVPGAGALRAPFRAAILGQAFLALLVGYGAARTLEWVRLRPRVGGRGAATMAVLLGMLVFGETVGRALPLDDLPQPASRVHAWLADQPGDFGVLDWPIPDALDRSAEGQWLSTRHWKRRVTGHNGRLPDDIQHLFELSFEPMSATFWETLVRRFPVRYVIVHLHAFDDETRDWLVGEGLPELTRWLQPVRAFGADRVYRVRNGGGAGRLERRLAPWMLPGTLRIRWTEPIPDPRSVSDAPSVPDAGSSPDGTNAWRLRVSLEDSVVADTSLEAGQTVTEVPLTAAPSDSPPWLRLQVEGPRGLELRVQRLDVLGPDGIIYP